MISSRASVEREPYSSSNSLALSELSNPDGATSGGLPRQIAIGTEIDAKLRLCIFIV